MPIAEKYVHKAVKYYQRRLTAALDRNDQFKEVAPAKDMTERMQRVSNTVNTKINVYERKILELGDKIDAEI